MKELYILLALVFIVLTVGFVDVKLKFSDGTHFTYTGWSHWIIK